MGWNPDNSDEIPQKGFQGQNLHPLKKMLEIKKIE